MDISIQILINMGLFSSYPRISQFFFSSPKLQNTVPCRPVAQGQVQLSMWDTKRQAGSRQLLKRGTEVVWDLNIANWKITMFNGKINYKWPFSLVAGWWFGTFFHILIYWLGMSSSQLTNIFQRGRYTTNQIR
jgi:hypothetical protein